MLICDTLNLVGVKPYDRKLYEKEMENSLKKRLLGLDRQQSKEDNILNELPPDTYLGKLMRTLAKQDDGMFTEDDLSTILDFEEEQFRLGNFEKIFPSINNVQFYSQFFECQRNANQLLMRYLAIISPKHNPHHVTFEPTGPAFTGSGHTRKKRAVLKQGSASASSALLSAGGVIKQGGGAAQPHTGEGEADAGDKGRVIDDIYEQHDEEGEEEEI